MSEDGAQAVWVFGLAAAAFLLTLGSLFTGYAALSPEDVVNGLMGGGGTAAIVVQEIRLPRALLALLVGAMLGMAGAALQGLTRNPLAEPGVTGVSAAAGLGAVIAIYSGLSAQSAVAVPLSAMAGAGAATAVLLLVAGAQSSTTLILAGVAIASLCGALTSLALNLATNAYAVNEIIFWLLGSLKDRSLADVALASPFALAGMGLLAISARGLDALALGDAAAESLGVNVQRLNLLVVLGVALGVGACVAVSGAIGFVGLMAAHLLRPFVGALPSRLLWPSAFAGAILLLLADIAVRMIPTSSEMMLGVMTAMIGAPFFFWLIVRQRMGGS